MRKARASLKGSIRFNSVQSLLGFLHYCHQNHQTLQAKQIGIQLTTDITFRSFSRLSFSSCKKSSIRAGLLWGGFLPIPCLAWPLDSIDLSRLAPLRHSTSESSESVEEGYICHIAFFEAGAKFRAWQFADISVSIGAARTEIARENIGCSSCSTSADPWGTSWLAYPGHNNFHIPNLSNFKMPCPDFLESPVQNKRGVAA